jgi:hypothetical protein
MHFRTYVDINYFYYLRMRNSFLNSLLLTVKTQELLTTHLHYMSTCAPICTCSADEFNNSCVLTVNEREYKLTQQDALLEDLS